MGWVQKKKQPLEQPIQEQPDPLPVLRAVPQPRNQPPQQNNAQVKERWVVVPELPTQPVRTITEDDGTIVHFLLVNEALTMVLNGELE